MKRENRLLGMYMILALLLTAFVAFITFDEPFKTLGPMIVLFCAGYALRESLDRNDEE